MSPAAVAPPPRPMISIVVPHLNEPEELSRCLASLAAQRTAGAPAFEVIVADNGSEHPPRAVCEAYPGTTMVIEPTPGPGPARNRGAALAKGEILAFIDCDCVADPGWIEVLAAHFRWHPQTAFIAGSIGILPKGPRMTGAEAYEAVFSYRVRMFVERQHFAATGNMAVRRTVFEQVGPFQSIDKHEDRAWGEKATAEGHRLDYVPEARVRTAGSHTVAQLKHRVDRHVAHDYLELGRGWWPRLRWLTRSAAVLASPLVGIFQIARSRDIEGVGVKLAAGTCLVRIRTYRALRMVRLLLRSSWASATMAGWNRSAGGGTP